jgi:putative DNA primase/helicase
MTKAIDQNHTPNSAALEYIADLIENGDDRYGFSSAFDLGAPHPAEGAAPEWFDDENFIRICDELPAQTVSTFHEQLVKCAQEPQNDTGNGQRLLKHFGADLLHVRDVGWHAWADTHWRREGGSESATRCAQMTAARIVLEADVMAATPIEQRMIDAGAEAREALAALDKIKDQSEEQRSKRKQLFATTETGDAAAGQLRCARPPAASIRFRQATPARSRG